MLYGTFMFLCSWYVYNRKFTNDIFIVIIGVDNMLRELIVLE
ncbi:hypothetical protein CNEO3_220056 [Clostridium neonatale]|nr:hypothetical protein CNEO3_220056 [Clostridium neonatale]